MDSQVKLEFSVVPNFPRALTVPLVGLGDFEVKHPGAVAYTGEQVPLLASLWVDLISGRPLPTRLVIKQVKNVEQLVCLSLFMDREVALSPKIPALVGSVELAKNLHAAGLAHIEPDLARLLTFLDQYLFSSNLNPKELSRKLQEALLWIRNYVLEGSLPNMPRPSDPPKILDHGTNGFVVAETRGRFVDAIVDVYRQGFLRGILFGTAGSSAVVCFKKSHYLRYDLEAASWRLNQIEGGLANWVVEGLHLHNPSTGIPRQLIIDTMLKV